MLCPSITTSRSASLSVESLCAIAIKPGEMIGLVGASGTGKSTMINLIMHLYELDDGELLIDGKDIRDIRLEMRWRSPPERVKPRSPT